jgi:hypothetical protein
LLEKSISGVSWKASEKNAYKYRDGYTIEARVPEFVIGDKVRIKNPTRFQANRGVMTKIGSSRITVQTKSGNKILRAPKNLILEA